MNIPTVFERIICSIFFIQHYINPFIWIIYLGGKIFIKGRVSQKSQKPQKKQNEITKHKLLKKNPGLWIMHIPLHSIIPVFHFCFIMWNVLYALKVHLFIIDLISFTQLFFTRHFITIYKPKSLKFCFRNLSYMYQMVISSELPLNSLKF